MLLSVASSAKRRCRADRDIWDEAMPRTTQEILDQAEELATRFERHEPVETNVRDATVLRTVHAAFQARADAERQINEAVTQARLDGHSWASIGAMLGTSGEAARQRHGLSKVAEDVVSAWRSTVTSYFGWSRGGPRCWSRPCGNRRCRRRRSIVRYATCWERPGYWLRSQWCLASAPILPVAVPHILNWPVDHVPYDPHIHRPLDCSAIVSNRACSIWL